MTNVLSAKYCHRGYNSLTQKKNSKHKWHWILSFLASFYRVKCQNYHLYLHGLPLATPTLSSVSSELTLMLNKDIKATFKVFN